MKSLIIILSLILSVNLCYGSEKSCSTGYACPLDKLIDQENYIKKQKLIDDIKKNNEQKMFKEYKLNDENEIKDYDDIFVYTKPKKNE